MSKRVTITPQIEATIRNSVGDSELDLSKVAVYEARFVSTEPVTKNGVYDGARISASTLHEMADYITASGQALPLHIMHNDRLLPVGKVVSGKVLQLENGEYELRGHFYLPLTEQELISKLDTSTIDEVSIGLLTKHAFCSECQFDYLPLTEDTFMNFMTATCDNGHLVGENGVHVRLHGLDDWSELSLVGQGAANKAKILPRARQSLSKDMMDRLAANKNLEAAIFFTASKINQGETEMSAEYEALLSKYEAEVKAHAETSANLKASTSTVATLEASVSEAKAALEASQKQVAELQASATQTGDEAKTALEAAKKEITEATEKLLPHVKAALVASGVAEDQIPTGLVALAALIEEKGLKLHQAVGASSTKVEMKDVDLTAGKDQRKEAFKLSK